VAAEPKVLRRPSTKIEDSIEVAMH